MYAIVEIAGKQYRVEKDQNIKVPLLHAESGSKVEFDRVLFYTDDASKIQIGKPALKDIKVAATVVEHGRDKKIVVFKKKRRKGYRVKKGHRQDYSLIKIDNISEVKAAKKAKPKEEAKAKVKPAEVKTETKPKTVSKAKSGSKTKVEPTKKSETKAGGKTKAKPKAQKPSKEKEA